MFVLKQPILVRKLFGNPRRQFKHEIELYTVDSKVNLHGLHNRALKLTLTLQHFARFT